MSADHDEFSVSKVIKIEKPQADVEASDVRSSEAAKCIVKQKPCTGPSQQPSAGRLTDPQAQRRKLRPGVGKSRSWWLTDLAH